LLVFYLTYGETVVFSTEKKNQVFLSILCHLISLDNSFEKFKVADTKGGAAASLYPGMSMGTGKITY
jgi:hypothetical protein